VAEPAPETYPRPLPAAVSGGLLAGLALGALEAGIVLGGNANFYDSRWLLLAVPLAALWVDGLGGALLGLLAGLLTPGLGRRRGSWLGLVAAGVPVLLRVRRDVAFTQNPLWPGLGLLLASAWVLLLLRGGPRAWRRARRGALAAALLLPVLAWSMLALQGDRQVPGQLPLGPPPAGPSLVLVTWDTVRADSLPPFGGGGLETPHLERLVREGILFRNFQATASITAPAHLSMLTGLYPPSHGLRANGDRPPVLPGQPRLPELLARRGWATAAFVSGYPLRRAFGFGRGFQTFDDRPAADPWTDLLGLLHAASEFAERLLPASVQAGATSTPGEVTVARAVAWLEAQEPGRPVFLWVHLFDAHDPYDPPEPWRSRALARAGEGPAAVSPECQEDLVLQRGEIELLDHLTGRLREALEARDPGLARTVLALVADHGECFGEGGILRAHEASLYAATQHVVAVLRLPGQGGGRRGVVADIPASQVDLLPTFCPLLGVPVPEGIQGRNLFPWLQDPPPPEAHGRGLYMEAFQRRLGDDRLLGWYQEGWRYLRALDGREMLLGPVTGDAVDLAARESARLVVLRQALDRALAAMPEVLAEEPEWSAADRRALEELGYAGGGE